ncbi:hypothetical protein LOD99_8582 [Oopsacas minuta]|uniref:Uncharacterized protein n=1 Tax=Oopsacas minuta TaxID=111878 RepID=A0AAV7JH19_9METZ|nr:hypothetical protein LOD99_8582 [Oopsacas minuta]
MATPLYRPVMMPTSFPIVDEIGLNELFLWITINRDNCIDWLRVHGLLPRGYLWEVDFKFNKRRGLSFSHEAVRIEMKQRGFTRKVARKIPKLTQTHKAYRVDWAKFKMFRYWKKAIFSNEMSIWLAVGKVCVWCKGDSKPVKPSTKHSPKFPVWGTFSARGTFPI